MKKSAKIDPPKDSSHNGTTIVSYEDRLSLDSRWAMTDASRFFEGEGAVQNALRKIAAKLNELGIDYAVAGGMALFHHGFRRFTEDVDILVTREALKEIHRKLDGLGYLPPFHGSKNLRETENGVKIEFIITGDYPGDGKPKPISFPNPADVAVEKDGTRYLNLPTLIELKLASGITNSARTKDIGDVQELMKVLNLPIDFRDQIHPFVREKFVELWHANRPSTKRYITIWRNKFLTADATSIEKMITSLKDAVTTLEAMLADGVVLDTKSGTADDYAYLVTSDPTIAKKYDMHDESEFWNDEEEQDSEADG